MSAYIIENINAIIAIPLDNIVIIGYKIVKPIITGTTANVLIAKYVPI